MLKEKKAFTAVDTILAIIIIIIFTTIVVSLMYNVKIENNILKLKMIANIHIIETLENISIAEYDEVTTDNFLLFPTNMAPEFEKSIEVTDVYQEDSTREDIIKKVIVTISYKINDKIYEEKAEILKVDV